MAAADHTRSGAEQRARTTAVAILAAAQNGTYACTRGPQAPSASHSSRHAVSPRLGVRASSDLRALHLTGVITRCGFSWALWAYSVSGLPRGVGRVDRAIHDGDASPTRADLPPGFDHVDLGQLLDVIEALIAFSRGGTINEEEGGYEVRQPEVQVLSRYRDAT